MTGRAVVQRIRDEATCASSDLRCSRRYNQSGCLGLVIAAAFALSMGSCSGQGVTAQRTTSSGGQPIVRLQNDRPRDVDLSKAHDAPADKVIPLEIDFAMRNKQQFDQLMQAISDPHSPEYHHWLTPQEMHARFGETQSQFDAVLRWLEEQGFTVTDKSYGTNADYIRFKGTVGQVEKAFDVELVTPEYDQYAAKNDPAIPAQFDGVISRVVGLEVVGPLD
jgi:Pro-kumamolisin, activation domain